MGESSSDTSDSSDGVGNFLFSIDIGVENTENESKIFFLLESDAALLLKILFTIYEK